MFEIVLKFISDAYFLFERLNLSVTGVIAIAIGLIVALMLAMREIAAWFFKIHDIKRDICDLHELNTQLEGEIRTLQALVSKLIDQKTNSDSTEKLPSVEMILQRPDASEQKSFPIVH